MTDLTQEQLNEHAFREAYILNCEERESCGQELLSEDEYRAVYALMAKMADAAQPL
jgi:hypothetical protein